MLRKKTTSNFEERRKERFERFPTLSKIPPENFPQHIFIIPDGNRRYAKNHGKPTVWGHQKGFNVALDILRFLRPLPIRAVTLWGFSSDNWKRSEEEVNHLMRIYGIVIDKYLDELMEENCKFVHIGRKDRIPSWLLKKFEMAEEKTKDNNGQIAGLAIDFSGEDQEIRMIEKAKNLPKSAQVTKDTLWELRDGKGIVKYADLIFRTSETRTSDVGWINGKHSVLYFLPDKLFPEVTETDMANAIEYFHNTKRNEGQ